MPRMVSQVVPNGERAVRVARCRNSTLGVRECERKRFLDQHGDSGARACFDLRGVRTIRGREDNHIDCVCLEKRFETRKSMRCFGNSMLYAKRRLSRQIS